MTVATKKPTLDELRGTTKPSLDELRGTTFSAPTALSTPTAVLDPNEETERFKESLNIADRQELSIFDVEDNFDIFDPSEPPAPEPTKYAMPPIMKFSEKQRARMAKESAQLRWEDEPTIQAVKDYFDVDKQSQLYSLETFVDPDEPVDFQSTREEYTYKQKARGLTDIDLDKVIQISSRGPGKIPDDLRNLLIDEQKIRGAVEQIKSLPSSGQSAYIILQRRSNLFNIPSYLSRKGIEKIWGLYGKETYIAIEAAERVLQEKNQKDRFNWTRALDLPAGIGQVILEFAAMPDITSKINTFSKLPVAAQSIISTSTKFAMKEVATLPTEEETVGGKVGKIATSAGTGAFVGGAGKYIPNPFVRIPAVTGGFMGLTAMQGGSGDEILEVGITILGFQALGIINKASILARTKLGRLRMARAIKAARKHNPDLAGVPDESIGTVLGEFKKITFWQRELKKGRVTQDVATMRINESLGRIKPIARAIQKETESKVAKADTGAKALQGKVNVSPKAAKRAIEIAAKEGVTKADQYLSAVKTVGEVAAEKVITEAKPPVKVAEKPEGLAEREPYKLVEGEEPISKEARKKLQAQGYTIGEITRLSPTEAEGLVAEAVEKPPTDPDMYREVLNKKWGEEKFDKVWFELADEATARKPVTAKEIITQLSKALKVPYASMATHKPRAAAGWYEVKSRGIRQIDVRDLDTAAHEVGHHIDHYFKIRQGGVSKIGRKTWKMPEGTVKGTAAELTRLGKMLYGERKPKGGYRSEGIAEYIRGYLTGHLNIEQEAPKFHKWFTEDYLPNNPEVAAGLENARNLLTDYRLQGAEARIESQINTKEIKGSLSDRANAANLWFQQMFVDEFAPLRKGIEEAGIKKGELKPTDDPYELAVYFTQKEGARARQMVLFGTIDLWGNKTGKGLKEIMKPIADQNAVRPFTHFVVAARSLNLLKKGVNPGISKEDAQYVYDLYKDNEGWLETAKEITEWNHRVLNYLVQAGALPKESADNMIKANPIYVPFLRAFTKGEKRFGGGGAGGGLITTKKGVFAIRGSGREIIDPFESMITQTKRMIAIAHKSVIARSLANLEARYRGLAGLIWKVPAPKKATTFRAEQAIKQLQKMGVEVTGEGLPEPGEMMTGKPEVYDALMTVYGNSPIYLGKDNIIAIVQNGKKSWYEVSPEMYRLMQGLDKFYMPKWLNATVGKVGRGMRLGATGLNAAFGLVKNPIRDMQDTIFKGTHARGPGATVKGVAKDLSRLGLAKSIGIEPSKAAEAFVAQGGQISGFVGQDRRSLQHLKGEMLASSIGRYTIHTLKHPIDAMREVFGVGETGPRIQEYEKALEVGEKKYGKGSPSAKVYAFNKAQDQTINYSRHGIIGKWLNQMVIFWNSNAQDISKVNRTFRERGKEATAYATAFLTLPALGLWWYNKDEEWYKELPAYEKANYIHVKIPGKDSITRIPVPFLVGHIFQGFPVATVDALYNADKTRVKEFFKEVLEADIYSLAEWPALVSPVIDVIQNKDWAGRPIVPRSVEDKLPSDQYKEYTTEFAKSIGKVLNESPAEIEHLMNSYSGGLYRRVAATAELAAGRREKELAAVDIPVIGKLFVRDPYAPRASIEKFYKRKELLEAKYRSDKITAGEIAERKIHNTIGDVLTELWKQLKEEKTIEGRKGLYRKVDELVKITEIER